MTRSTPEQAAPVRLYPDFTHRAQFHVGVAAFLDPKPRHGLRLNMYLCRQMLQTMRFNRILAVLAFALSAALSAQDLSGIKVDNLSDSEIRNILNQGQARGLGIEDGENLALGMGIPAGEAAKFK